MAAFGSWTRVDFVWSTVGTGFRYRPTRSTVILFMKLSTMKYYSLSVKT